MSVGLVCKSLLARPTPSWPRRHRGAMGNVGRRTTAVHFRDHHARARCSTTGHGPAARPGEPGARAGAERYGALFDRTKEGLISQRDFAVTATRAWPTWGPHRLEMIRTLQYHAIHQPIEVYMGVQDRAADQGRGPRGRGLRVLRNTASSCSSRPRPSCSPPRHRQGVEVHLELLGVHRDGHSLAVWRAPTSSTWSSSSSTRPDGVAALGCAASW